MVDQKLCETKIVKEAIDNQIVQTRTRLQPFVNQGFNHKDRRFTGYKSTSDPKLAERRALGYMKNRAKIDKYGQKLEKAI